jgi:hypothetical protein
MWKCFQSCDLNETADKELVAVFKEKHGAWDPMPELTITHFIS